MTLHKTVETKFLAVRGGKIHEIAFLRGRRLVDERCNLDDADQTYEVTEDEALSAPDSLCEWCFPFAKNPDAPE